MVLQPEPYPETMHTQMLSGQTPMGTFATNLTDKLNKADNVVEPESIQLEFVDQKAEVFAPSAVQH